MSILPAAQEDSKNRLSRAVSELAKAFAIAAPHEKAIEIRDDVGFFQAVQSVLTERVGKDRKSLHEIDQTIRQIAWRAIYARQAGESDGACAGTGGSVAQGLEDMSIVSGDHVLA